MTTNGGQGGDEALELAKATAVEAMEEIVEIMRSPKRNSGTKLAAAKLLLELAGVGSQAADQRHTELLAALKGRISEGARAEVIRALADGTAVSGEGAEQSEAH